jgi:hypothetical protein
VQRTRLLLAKTQALIDDVGQRLEHTGRPRSSALSPDLEVHALGND